jgi:hypothetical protein
MERQIQKSFFKPRSKGENGLFLFKKSGGLLYSYSDLT